jgi:hypothetical protein
VHLGIEELRAISGDIFASCHTGRASCKIVDSGPVMSHRETPDVVLTLLAVGAFG